MVKKVTDMRQIPKSIMIGGLEFKIEKAHLDDKCGEMDLNKRIIRLESSDSTADQWNTLFHEMIHACIGIAGLSYVLGENTEEAVVMCLDSLLWPTVEIL